MNRAGKRANSLNPVRKPTAIQREIIEIQGTGEQTPFSREKLNRMLDMAEGGIKELLEEQRRAIEE